MVPLYAVDKHSRKKKCLYHRKVVVYYGKNTAGMLEFRSVGLCVHARACAVCVNLLKEVLVVVSRWQHCVVHIVVLSSVAAEYV